MSAVLLAAAAVLVLAGSGLELAGADPTGLILAAILAGAVVCWLAATAVGPTP